MCAAGVNVSVDVCVCMWFLPPLFEKIKITQLDKCFCTKNNTHFKCLRHAIVCVCCYSSTHVCVRTRLNEPGSCCWQSKNVVWWTDELSDWLGASDMPHSTLKNCCFCSCCCCYKLATTVNSMLWVMLQLLYPSFAWADFILDLVCFPTKLFQCWQFSIKYLLLFAISKFY